MTRSGSRSDIDRSTAANDSRIFARPHLLRLVTMVNVEQAPGVLIVLLLAITMNVMPPLSVLRAEDTSRVPMQLTQLSQAPRKGPFLEGSQMVRPSPREREAIYQLLALKPRPKTLKDADIKFLQRLRDKASWFVFEQRLVHEIWADVNGKEWRDTEGPQPPNNESSR